MYLLPNVSGAARSHFYRAYLREALYKMRRVGTSSLSRRVRHRRLLLQLRRKMAAPTDRWRW
jgi:hypothetical protein